MTLRDAIKSHKKFKRPKHATWLTEWVTETSINNIRNINAAKTNSKAQFYTLTPEDILADDWIVREKND